MMVNGKKANQTVKENKHSQKVTVMKDISKMVTKMDQEHLHGQMD
jgi:hypothetical protein